MNLPQSHTTLHPTANRPTNRHPTNLNRPTNRHPTANPNRPTNLNRPTNRHPTNNPNLHTNPNRRTNLLQATNRQATVHQQGMNPQPSKHPITK